MTATDKPFRINRRRLNSVGGDNDSPPPAGGYLVNQLIVWPEFWAHDHGSEEWLAWPLIPAHRQTALFAPAKEGKSWIALAVCAALATGRSILGQPAQPPRHVLYLDYEMTAGDLQERLEALGYGPDVDLSYLHYALLPSLPPLNSIKGCVAVLTLARDVNAELVVIDTMGRAVDGEENSADSYREFARTTGLALKAAGMAVLRTDHAGKEREKGQRGSSAKNDDVDVVMRIDTIEGGWTLTRTHTRIAWVPEKVAIARTDHADGTVALTIDTRRRTYVTGTKELVAVMRTLGITADTSQRAASTMLQDVGEGVRTKRVIDALAWMKAELPMFTGPVDNHGETGGKHPGKHPFEIDPEADSEAMGETPGQNVGKHDGKRPEAQEAVSGKRSPPLRGERSPTQPDDPDDIDELWPRA